ncbi:MAG: alpha/beta fold hydrolase [Pseudonocardiaceae bacterium]
MRIPPVAGLVLAGAAVGWAARHGTAPAVRDWRPGAGGTWRAGGLWVRAFGTGDPVIVLLHGLVAAGNCFGAGFDRLGACGTVVVPDLLGFGGSPAPPGTFTPAAQLDALTDMINGLGLSGCPIVVAGHSMGSVIALRWAAQGPGQIRGIVAFCPPLYRTRFETDARIREMGRMAAFLAGDGPLPRALCDWMCRHRSAASWLAVATQPELPVVQHSWETYRGSFEAILASPAWEPALRRLAAAAVPITFLEGARDAVPVPGRTAALAATLPHSTHRVHPDADHYLPLTHAAWCAA